MRDEAHAELAQIERSDPATDKTIADLKQRFGADKVRFQELMELKALTRQ